MFYRRGEPSASHSDRFSLGERVPRYPLNRRLDGFQSRSGRFWIQKKFLPITGIKREKREHYNASTHDVECVYKRMKQKFFDIQRSRFPRVKETYKAIFLQDDVVSRIPPRGYSNLPLSGFLYCTLTWCPSTLQPVKINCDMLYMT